LKLVVASGVALHTCRASWIRLFVYLVLLPPRMSKESCDPVPVEPVTLGEI